MIQCSSWEVGVVLTVPRGTDAIEAERRMAFDTWPIQFDVSALHRHAYTAQDEQEARDTFAVYPALKAKAQGDPEWRALIPPDVKARMASREDAADLHALETVLHNSVKHHGGAWGVYDDAGGDDDEEEEFEAAMRASRLVHAGRVQRTEAAELEVALRLSRQEFEMSQNEEQRHLAAALAASREEHEQGSNGLAARSLGKRSASVVANGEEMRAARLRALGQ